MLFRIVFYKLTLFFVENWIILAGMMWCLIKSEVTFKASLLLRVKIIICIIGCFDSIHCSVWFFRDFLKSRHLRKQILWAVAAKVTLLFVGKLRGYKCTKIPLRYLPILFNSALKLITMVFYNRIANTGI